MNSVNKKRARTSTLFPALCLLLITGCGQAQSTQVLGGDVQRGKKAIDQESCVACHAIPGISGPSGNVGSSLKEMAKRAYIAGVLANTPANMVRWLRNPPAVDPLTAMPNLGITEVEAKDIAAYLYTLD